MALNILSNVALAYQPIWGPDRRLSAVRLRVRAVRPEVVDATHLMAVLAGEWSAGAPHLYLSFADRGLLSQALVHAPVEPVQLELPDATLPVGADLAPKVAAARRLGHRCLAVSHLSATRPQSGGGLPSLPSLLHLGPDHLAQARRWLDSRAEGHKPSVNSPVLPGHFYQDIPDSRVAAHCLDDQGALGVAGWPVADTLKGHRHFGVRPDRQTIIRLQQALMHDKAMDRVESLIHQDPVLTFRLLRQTPVRNWLMAQLPGAATDADLGPVRQGMVLRGRLMEHLMDPGHQHELRADIYTTGLFSQLDPLTQEPLAKTLARLPLSDAVVAALLRQSGPYHPYLDIATHMEGLEGLDTVAVVCDAHSFPLEAVNRALLRMLSRWNSGL